MAGPSKEVKEAFCTVFEKTFFHIMVGMTKADSVEADFAKLQAEVRDKTKTQLKKIARFAGEYYADQTNPDPTTLSEEEADSLQRKAIEFALNKFANEEKNKRTN
jgi:hypothetical protein